MSDQDGPGILYPPPLGWLLGMVGTVALGRWLPLGVLPPFPWLPGVLVGGAIFAAAVWINVTGFLAFRKAETNVNPYKPALTVVRNGPYRFTRNAVYLGMVLSVFGLGLVCSTLWGPLLAAVLFLTLHFGVVLREERYMEAKFGEAYTELLATTRRWL